MIGYIRKDNNCNILDKLLCKTIKSSYENGIEYKSVKFNKKLLKILMKDNIKTVVIAKKDKAEKEFINMLYANNINILTGRILFKHLLPEIIEYLSDKVEITKEMMEIAILVNDFSKINLFYINEILSRVKNVNIVTNNISKFKRWSNDMYNKQAIVIPIMNNKNKSLKNKNYIINIDFPEEQLNKYKINRKAIIINIEENINIKIRGFEGINANSYIIKQVDALQEFNYNEIYESYIINNQINEIRRKIENDRVKITYLIGKNGIIDNSEYKNL